MTEREEGYLQALIDLKAWHEQQIQERHLTTASTYDLRTHGEAIRFIDGLIAAKKARKEREA